MKISIPSGGFEIAIKGAWKRRRDGDFFTGIGQVFYFMTELVPLVPIFLFIQSKQ